ncbi:MAG: hypothetical protein HY858_16245 [Candidatus Solibacter usitatus]|nr:hypothetical protein [Candidatus Solibacter usitatus]
MPALPGAQIVTVKQLGDAVRLLQQKTGADAQDLAELRLLEAEVKRLLAANPARQRDTVLLAELRRLAADLRPS